MSIARNSRSDAVSGFGASGSAAPFWLRYYAPSFDRQVEEQIKSLLAEIAQAQHLQTEIVELRLVPSKLTGQTFPDSAHEEEIYKRHFLPRKSLLKGRTGISLREQLRSNSGRYNLAGTLVIVSQSGVEWLCPPYGKSAEFGFSSDPRLDFLLAVRAGGSAFLVKVCPPVTRGQPEAELIDSFLSYRLLDGTVQREVPVGGHRFSTEFGTFDWRKAIDLLIESPQEIWIIEAKIRLNTEALGQVLLYGDLYEEERDHRPVKLAIVCRQLEAEVLRSCHKRGITIFQVSEDGPLTLPPTESSVQ